MPPIQFKKLGAIPYTRTGKELQLGALSPATSGTYEDEKFFSTPILMQGKSPECGGYSPAFAIAHLLNLQQKLSGSFTYAYEKTVDGVPNEQGTTIKAIGDAVQAAGSCLETLFPDDGDVNKNPEGTPTLYDKATPPAIADAVSRAGYTPLFLNDLSWFGLQSAIEKYGFVIVEAQVGNEWWTDTNGQDSWSESAILPIRPPAPVVDSHFFVLGGKFDINNIWFANSWSTEWGHNGFGYFQRNYIPFIQNAMVFYKTPKSVEAIQNHPTLTQDQKNSIIQQIINDIHKALGLIKQEAGL